MHGKPPPAGPPPLYSGPRCADCGGDHFAAEPTPEHARAAETKLISDAVGGSPVLHRFVNRIGDHFARHKSAPTCELCFAWVEYFYGIMRKPIPAKYLPPSRAANILQRFRIRHP